MLDIGKWGRSWKKLSVLVGLTDRWKRLMIRLIINFFPVYTNFQAMTPSIKKIYTRAYLDAKTDAGCEKRIVWMVDRLKKYLKPM